MDFARKQLEKFGWKEGNGLGKDNQGMLAAIKPALKLGKEGMGYDFSKELVDTWWTRAYDDSLKRIHVDESIESVGVSLQGEDDAEENEQALKGGGGSLAADEERPFFKMKKRMMKAAFPTFSKGATLANGEMISEPEPEDPENGRQPLLETKPPTGLTDEELFRACGGRTAHKAARFGLKLNGKLARIAAQEAATKALLSQSSKCNSVVDKPYSSLPTEFESIPTIKRKKKKSKDKTAEVDYNVEKETVLNLPPSTLESPVSLVQNDTETKEDNFESKGQDLRTRKKRKKDKKRKYNDLTEEATTDSVSLNTPHEEPANVDTPQETKSKKKKHKHKKRVKYDDEDCPLLSE